MMTEHELILGCKLGNQDCQRQLVDSYAPYLMSVCRRYAPCDHQTHDILQETFINVFKYIKSFDINKGAFKFWIRRVAINTALKHLDKNKIDHEEISDMSGEFSSFPKIYSQLAEEELLKQIEKLPDGYKQIFNLNIIEGYSHSEISELLSITESTSRSNLARARKILRSNISKHYNTYRKKKKYEKYSEG